MKRRHLLVLAATSPLLPIEAEAHEVPEFYSAQWTPEHLKLPKRRKLWKSETDHWSACTLEEAQVLRRREYSWGPEDGESDPFESEPMPDDEILSVTYIDDDEGCPSWVANEPEAEQRRENLPYHPEGVLVVSAPARVWAKHEEGLVCSTEF